jgi:hypothetical protein
MKSPSKKRAISPFGNLATAFIHTVHFDMDFNYIGENVDQTIIYPGADENWESQTCTEIPHIRYEYTCVTKKSPETSQSGLDRIEQIRKKVKFLAGLKKKNSVLRIVKETVQTEFAPPCQVTYYALQESYASLCSDKVASKK